MVDTVCNYLELTKDQVFYSKRHWICLSCLRWKMYSVKSGPCISETASAVYLQLDSASPVIPQILDHDVLLSYPYESIPAIFKYAVRSSQ